MCITTVWKEVDLEKVTTEGRKSVMMRKRRVRGMRTREDGLEAR